jgi:hypothetical protein
MNTEFASDVASNGVGINWCSADCLPRDRGQSQLLHEPEWMITNIDPLTGRDIDGLADRPRIVDHKVTIYFESEETRQSYIDFPAARSVPLPDNPTGDGEAEG